MTVSAISLPCDAVSGVSLECGVRARMRDGTFLVADIYRPDNGSEGPWPVLLMRQPYGRDIASTVVYAHPTWYARRGFMVVIQDVRGRGESEGSFYAFRNESDDGYDTVLWAAALPGSNGRVGMYGFSYQGSTQLLAALGKPAPLKALAPHMTAFDLYSGWFYRNGILQLSTTVGWASQMLREDSRRGAREAEALLDLNWQNTGALSQCMPLVEAEPLVHPAVPSYGADWVSHSSYDAYWEEFDLLKRVEDLNLPMFHVSGWYDFYLRGSVDGYAAMREVNPHQFLVAGPWIHLPWGPKTAAGDLGSAAVSEIDEQLAAWFRHWLDHEEPEGEAPLKGCRYFVSGANTWRNAAAWPPSPVRQETFFLQSAGKANSIFGDGLLSHEGPGGPDDLFNYDPEVPVAAPGGNQGGHAGFGPFDLQAQQQGNNLLVYTSAPLATSVTFAGVPVVVLHVQSSAIETDFVARLSKVQPDGRAVFLCLGAVRAKAREPLELSFSLDPTAVHFKAGEALRLDIASSAFPLLIRNPNTGSDPAHVSRPADFRRALQVVKHSSASPSRLVLPVVGGDS